MVGIALPPLHNSQLAILDALARFIVLSAGRRWGKSRLGVYLCVEAALRGGTAWWVSPSYKMGSVGWWLIKALVWQIPGADIRETDRLVTLPGGGTIQVRSADDPNSLRGFGLDFVVLDECAYMSESAWLEALRPALSDRKGRALFISTPKGRNWFWRLSISSDPDYVTFTYPTSSNPHIDPQEIEDAKRNLPDRIFRQEYLAEFLEDGAGVFRRVRDAATAEPQGAATDGHSYVAGIDWGRSNDFTVISVIDQATKELVYMDRFSEVGYELQLGRLEGVRNRFEPFSIVAESNSMGQPLIERLQAEGWPVQAFYTSSASKAEVIESLALAFENQELRILNDETLISELEAFAMDTLPSGRFRYGAPEGIHDDTVMSLALAWNATTSGVDWLWM